MTLGAPLSKVCVIAQVLVAGRWRPQPRVYRARARYQKPRGSLPAYWQAYQRENRLKQLRVLFPADEGILWARGWERRTVDALLAAYLLATSGDGTGSA